MHSTLLVHKASRGPVLERTRIPRFLVFAGFAALLGACAPTGPVALDQRELAAEAAFQKRLALEEQVADRERLDAVAFRVNKAAAPFCLERRAINYGMTLATRSSFGPDMAQTAAEVYGLDHRANVLSVVPGSPADLAGLRRGDIVTEVNASPVDTKGNAVKSVMLRLEESGKRGAVLRVAGVNPRQVELSPAVVCNYPVRIIEKTNVNAYADGKRITLTRGMMWFASKDVELALVLSHELAHNIMGHAGSFRGAFTDKKSREADADYVGLYFMARGGYEIEEAPHFWRRIAAAFPSMIEASASHPVMPYRFVALRKATAEIRAKQAAGIPLIPRRTGGLADAASGSGTPES